MARAKRALIIIDMLRDFLEKDGALYCGSKARRIIPFIGKSAESFRNKNDIVIYAQDNHTRRDREFGLFGRHCIRGTAGQEVIPEIEPRKRDYVVPKATYDATFRSKLIPILISKHIKDVFLVGVCTSICVMETASSLTKQGFRVHILKKGVADFDGKAHRFALKRMQSVYGARIV